MAIQVGSTVYLKFDGTKMSVKLQNITGQWVCTLKENGKYIDRSFAEEQLTEIVPPSSIRFGGNPKQNNSY